MRGEVTRRARTQATGTHAGLYTIPRLLSPFVNLWLYGRGNEKAIANLPLGKLGFRNEAGSENERD